MTIHTVTHTVVQQARPRRRLGSWLYRFYLRRQTRRILERLNDDQLKDIGLRRTDIRRDW
ncbi:hypothetical protein BTJ39_22730 [Izhakiella australiensis]|uniref:YjiS-like domain-containing protein n=1 Tax=Izhakiella australiensis TaxID=1926881 RepID=A0A1S8Y9T1_9GAMM|nr:DUF1127 domain-containing protein [Izhakiella australiensis]OON35538.1 hypothetical protein BTJ39_22730 [Izhakiella australiensis]